MVGSSDKNIYAVLPDGRLRWKIATGAAVASSPAIAAEGTVYVVTDVGTAWSIAINGEARWTYKTGETVSSSPAIAADGAVYVASADGRLYAFH